MPPLRPSLASLPIAAMLLCQLAPIARAVPADPFVGAAPSSELPAPDTSDLDAGDWGVADQTGAATYTLPIVVPPGRKGMQPALSLRYSSTAPLRGGIAAGWSMELPSIEVERSSIAGGALRYAASLKASSGNLVVTGETSLTATGATAYRLAVDDDFVRFEYVDASASACEFAACRGGWVAFTPDGTRHYFDETPDAHDPKRRWMLTEEVDAWGNATTYTWQSVYDLGGRKLGRRLLAIEYSSNSAAGVAAHARVELAYAALETCPGTTTPVGATVEYDVPGTLPGTGRRFVSPTRLISITTRARPTPGAGWRIARYYGFGYDQPALACSQQAAPLRYLTRIDALAYDAAGALTLTPPITFEYGRQRRLFDTTGSSSFTGGVEAGTQKGATTGLIDVNGDGLRDLSTTYVSNGACVLSWRGGQRGGGYAARATVWTLPSAAWRGGTTPDAAESCLFTGQITFKQNQTVPTGCHNGGSVIGYRFIDWDRDGLDDLVLSVWRGGFFLPGADLRLNGNVAFLDDDPAVPDPEDPCSDERSAEYRLRVHRNTGSGFHPIPQRIGLPPNGPSVPPPGNHGTLQASQLSAHAIGTLTDINGDGLVDLVDTRPGYPLGTSGWRVYLGSTTGFGAERNWFVPPFGASNAGTGMVRTELGLRYEQSTSVALRDISGDGLPDLVVQTSGTRNYFFPGGIKTIGPNQLIAFVNGGDGFGEEPMALASAGAIDVSQTNIRALDGTNTIVEDGDSGYRRRLIDLDGDGLLDQVLIGGLTTNIFDGTTLGVSYGVGDGFGPTQSIAIPDGGGRLKRIMTVDDRSWWVRNDLTDVDGDDLVDLAEWSAVGGIGLRWRTEAAAPMRLLTRVVNGRGATTTYSYVPSTDRAVVTLAGSPDKARLPGTRWVVSQVATAPGAGQPTMTTSYRYAEPAFGSPTGAVVDGTRFLGFRTVTTERAGWTTIVTTYHYELPGAGPIAVDREGRPITVDSWSYDPAQGRYEMVKRISTSYTAESLLGGATAFVHRNTSMEWVCPADITEATQGTCVGPAVEPARTLESWVPVRCGTGLFCGLQTPPIAFVRSELQQGRGMTTSVDDKKTVTGYQVRTGQSPYLRTDYRILPISTDLQGRVGSAWQTAARSDTIHDTTGNPTQQRQQLDAAGTTAITTYTFDALGNVVTIRKPSQQPGGAVSTLGYDGHKLHVTTTTNELAQLARQTTDVATGQQTRRDGLNTGCGGACGEHEAVTLDGFGRVRERRVGMGASFTSTLVEKTTYTDGAPSKIKREQLIDVGGTAWVTTETELDGLGRPVVETRPVPGKPAAVTRWSYDAGGALIRIDAPDPTVDTGATVAHRYHRDGAGRLVRFERPDGTGLDVLYNGRLETRRDHTADFSGGELVQVHDVFGRLTEVRQGELGAATAITRYGYGPSDALAQVIDADGNLTLIATDRAGRRIGVTRGSRTWTLGYDRDGNVISILSPRPVGAVAAEYTTTISYDALGRIKTRLPARRGKSDTELATLGIGPVLYGYDTAVNGKGRLAVVEARRYGAAPRAYGASFAYDERGLVTGEFHNVTTTSPIAVTTTRNVSRTYNALGQPIEVDLLDGNRWRRVHDTRGLVQRVERHDAATATWVTLASYDRSLLGATRVRTGPGSQARRFAYDQLGRVTGDVVNAGPTRRMQMTYRYAGDDNLHEVTGHSGGLTIAGSYEYDALGQLTFAEGPGGQWGAFAYSPAGNVLTVDDHLGAVDRDFDYDYAAPDPQAVTSIVHLTTGEIAAAYGYDASGNVVSRSTPAGVYGLTWDGEDRLRASDGPAGREVYLYDHAGQRIAAVDSTGARIWIAGAELRFDAAGALTSRYAHVSDGGQTIARIENGTTVEIQYADMLHNVVLGLSVTGAVNAAFSYGPYGEVLSSIGAGNHRRQFNGKEVDLKTGLHYHGARYYDDVTRRWISGDPKYRIAPDANLGEPLRQNLYAFNLNNPVRYHDPDGLEGFELDPLGPVHETKFVLTESDHHEVSAEISGADLSLGASAEVHAYKKDGLTIGSAAATGTISKKGLDVAIGGTLISKTFETGRACSGSVCASAGIEVGLKVELGVAFGAKTKIRLPLVTFSIDLGLRGEADRIAMPDAASAFADSVRGASAQAHGVIQPGVADTINLANGSCDDGSADMCAGEPPEEECFDSTCAEGGGQVQ